MSELFYYIHTHVHRHTRHHHPLSSLIAVSLQLKHLHMGIDWICMARETASYKRVLVPLVLVSVNKGGWRAGAEFLWAGLNVCFGGKDVRLTAAEKCRILCCKKGRRGISLFISYFTGLVGRCCCLLFT